jgi:hypothetical protein
VPCAAFSRAAFNRLYLANCFGYHQYYYIILFFLMDIANGDVMITLEAVDTVMIATLLK